MPTRDEIIAELQRRRSGGGQAFAPQEGQSALMNLGMGGMQPSSVRVGPVSFQDPTMSARQQTMSQEMKAGSKALRDQRKAQALLEQSLLLWGKAAKHTKEGVNLPPGRISRVASKLGKFTGLNPFAEPFEGDKVETATAISKLASPSSRPGPELINAFSKTLMNLGSTFVEAREQAINSMANGIYERESASGKEPDISRIRAMVASRVDRFISNRPDVFQGIAPDSYFQGKQTAQKQPQIQDDPLGLFS